MPEGSAPARTPTEYTRQRTPRLAERPDRVALWAVVLGVVMMVAAAASAQAGSGGTGTTTAKTGRYAELWEGVSDRNKRWARRTSECESGGDPNAIGGGGTYRGAFQFMRETWRSAPKSPGGDPIDYSWRTQAVVAVYKKRRDGTSAWPVCG